MSCPYEFKHGLGLAHVGAALMRPVRYDDFTPGGINAAPTGKIHYECL
jgi:hypothetical protein